MTTKRDPTWDEYEAAFRERMGFQPKPPPEPEPPPEPKLPPPHWSDR
jgi:hypothetical protein